MLIAPGTVSLKNLIVWDPTPAGLSAMKMV